MTITNEDLERLAENFKPIPFQDQDGNTVGTVDSVRIEGNKLIGRVRMHADHPGLVTAEVDMLKAVTR